MGREDYIVRHIQMVGQFIAQMLNARHAGREDQAIQIGVQAVERLFGLRMDEVAAYSMEAQYAHLAKGLAAGEARGRQFAYALLLKELGFSYRGGAHPEVALSSFKAALWVCLRLLLDNEGTDDAVVALAREMLASIPPEAVDAPLQEYLALVSDRLNRDQRAPT